MSSLQLTSGYYDILNSYGPDYKSFYKSNGNHTKVEIYSTRPFDVYVSRGNSSDPNEFSYDLAFTNTMFAKLDSYNFEALTDSTGYTVNTYSNSFDEAANTYLSSQMLVSYQEPTSTFESVQASVSEVIATTSEALASDRPIASLLNALFQ